jgi:phosphoribosyl 1,2-cyclic phosphate phosphodiesterase
MKVTFLGTAAAEGYPALWCRCERCVVARERGGENLRLRSSVLINDDLLIDPGPDLVGSTIRLGVDVADVQAILITHLHDDHLDPTGFLWRGAGFALPPLPVAEVIGTAPTLGRLHDREGKALDPAGLRFSPRPVSHGERVSVSTGGTHDPDPRVRPGRTRTSDGAPPLASLPTPPDLYTLRFLTATVARSYEIVVLPASHARPDEQASFFVVRQTLGPELTHGQPATVLYATDTGPFSDDAWNILDQLADDGWTFGASIIDATLGLGGPGTAHMNLEQVVWHQGELGRRELLAPDAGRFAHHFSHNGTPPHQELTAHLAQFGVMPSHDGLVTHVGP